MDWEIYVDESGSTSKQDRYLVFGGILIRRGFAEELSKSIYSWREKDAVTDEIKWTKVTPKRLERYKRFIRGTMHHARLGHLAYRCTVFDKTEIRFRRKGKGPDGVYYKLMYHFLLHNFLKQMGVVDSAFVYPDQRHTNYDFDELRADLNIGVANIQSRPPRRTVRSIELRDSKGSNFIQMADILSGALASWLNGTADPLSKRGAAKISLGEYLLDLSGVGDLIVSRLFCKSLDWVGGGLVSLGLRISPL